MHSQLVFPHTEVQTCHTLMYCKFTLKVLVTRIDAQWEGMGDVGSARYEPALLSPCPTIRVLMVGWFVLFNDTWSQ